MTNHNLRYFGLGAYTGLIALWTATGQLALNLETAGILLAPIAAIVAADYWKHKDDTA